MAVVINEFEIVTEPPKAEHDSDDTNAQMEKPQALQPHDLAAAIRHERERRARVWAH